jgi:hypothetical protein
LKNWRQQYFFTIFRVIITLLINDLRQQPMPWRKGFVKGAQKLAHFLAGDLSELLVHNSTPVAQTTPATSAQIVCIPSTAPEKRRAVTKRSIIFLNCSVHLRG